MDFLNQLQTHKETENFIDEIVYNAILLAVQASWTNEETVKKEITKLKCWIIWDPLEELEKEYIEKLWAALEHKEEIYENKKEMAKFFWIEKVKLFRIDADEKAISYAENLFRLYKSEMVLRLEQNPNLTKILYVRQCESLVTPYLFQPPLLEGCLESNWKRDIYNKAFSDWNPNSYCTLFYQKIKMLLN